MKIHHIGYLVEDVECAAEEFTRLGFARTSDVERDLQRDVFILFLRHCDGYVVELIQPVSDASPYYGLRKKYRNAPYHFCYVVDDLQREIEKMTSPGSGNVLLQPPQPAPAIPGCPNVAFLMNRYIGMVELLEET